MDWDPQELCLLQGSFLFCGLEAPLARRLAAQGSRACFSAGQTIYGVGTNSAAPSAFCFPARHG